MNSQQTNNADLAKDLENLGEEITNELGAELDETHPADYQEDDWSEFREAIKSMREKLDEMERMLDEKLAEAEEYDPEGDKEKYESYWG